MPTVAQVLDALNRHFEASGTVGDHKLPNVNDPSARLLRDFFRYSEGNKFFEKSREAIKEKIIKEIVPKEFVFVVGQTHQLYDTPHFALNCQVKKGQSFVDNTKFATELRKLGVKQEIIDKALAAASGERSPQRVFSVALL